MIFNGKTHELVLNGAAYRVASASKHVALRAPSFRVHKRGASTVRTVNALARQENAQTSSPGRKGELRVCINVSNELPDSRFGPAIYLGIFPVISCVGHFGRTHDYIRKGLNQMSSVSSTPSQSFSQPLQAMRT